MRTNFRVLNVENIEDRSVPSSFHMIEVTILSHFAPANDHSYATFATVTFEFRGITADGRMVNVRIQEPVLLVSRSPMGMAPGTSTGCGQLNQYRRQLWRGVNDDGPAESGTSPEVGSATGPTISAPRLVAHNQ